MNIKDKVNSLFETIKKIGVSQNKCVNPFITNYISLEEMNTIIDIISYHPEARNFVSEWKTIRDSTFGSYILKTFLEENGIPVNVCLQAGINLFYAQAKYLYTEKSKQNVDYFYTLNEHANTHSLCDFIYFVERYMKFGPK